MFTELEESVLSEIYPGEEELSRARSVASRLCKRAEELASSRGIKVEAMVVGSLAKGTFMRGVDIDLFILFPADTPRAVLEETGLFIGHSLLGGEERYAEHPYVHGIAEGFEVDLVPCYHIQSPSQKMSAVDRTPFHTRFILENIDDEARKSVLLLKQFMRGVGVYGAEASVGGFSGYLCELLVLKFGDFRQVLAAACGWKSGLHLSLKPGKQRFKEPLAFIDPVDPTRNVAAAVTQQSMGLFIHASREYLKSPMGSFFFPHEPGPVSLAEASAAIAEKGTSPMLVAIPRPPSVQDVLYPQVHKFRRTVVERLEEDGYPVVFHKVFLEKTRVALFLELGSGERPGVYRHIGPPVWSPQSEKFLEKWKSISKPYVDDGRWVVDAPRSETLAEDTVMAHIAEWGIGKELSALAALGNVEAYAGDTALENMSADMLSEAFDRRFPWER